jgi:uridine kinase
METNIFVDEHALIKCIENLSLESPAIVSIDGVDGVGKTTLACKIAEEMSLPYIEIDTFVQEQQGGYIDHIDYDRLSEVIKQAKITNQVIILEGVCVQQVLKKLGLNSYAKIYVKVINNYPFWMDRIRLFPPDKSADEMIAERKAKGFSLGHVEDIIRYHYTFKPHENADYIFERKKL